MMASIRPCPKSPTKLEIRFTCVITKKPRSVAVGSGDMQAAERLKAKIEDVILKVRNGEKKKPSDHLLKSIRLSEWYKLGGDVSSFVVDLRREWLAELENSVSYQTLVGYRKHVLAFDLSDPRSTVREIQERLSVDTARRHKITFSAYWSWLLLNDYTEAPDPLRAFKFDQTEEKQERWSYRDLSEHLKKHEGLTPKDHRWAKIMRDRVFLAGDEYDTAKKWVKEFFAKKHNDRKFALACLLSAESGLRRGEIVRIRKQDFDFDTRILTIRRTKGSGANHYKTTRTAVAPDTALELQRFMDDSDLEYPFARSAMPADGTAAFQKVETNEASHIGNLLKTRAARFPFPGALFGYHLFRHSLNAKLKTVNTEKGLTMGVMGHSTQVMYHHYGGTDEKELRAAVDAIA